MAKLTDKTLGEVSANGDGTYNGLTALRWMFEALTGKPLSENEVNKLADEARAKAHEKKAAKNG